jgi:hypothetical protein
MTLLTIHVQCHLIDMISPHGQAANDLVKPPALTGPVPVRSLVVPPLSIIPTSHQAAKALILPARRLAMATAMAPAAVGSHGQRQRSMTPPRLSRAPALSALAHPPPRKGPPPSLAGLQSGAANGGIALCGRGSAASRIGGDGTRPVPPGSNSDEPQPPPGGDRVFGS